MQLEPTECLGEGQGEAGGWVGEELHYFSTSRARISLDTEGERERGEANIKSGFAAHTKSTSAVDVLA